MTALTSTCAFTTSTETILGLLGAYPPVLTNPKGPLASRNNNTGVTQIGVALTGTTAKTWTHNFGVLPVAVDLFSPDGRPIEAKEVVVTTTVNSITLTPLLTCNVTVLVTWQLGTQFIDGVPTVNFV